MWTALLWLVPLVYLAAHLSAVPYQPGSIYSDFEIAHMANAEFLRYSLFGMGEFPLWSPVLLGGAPFHADPLAGIFYLPGWLGYLLPQPLGLNLLVILHFGWLALGTARLGRLLGLSLGFSLVAGLFVLLLPKLWAHYAAGHVSLLFAVSWTPWLAAAGIRSARSTRFGRQSALSALIFSLGVFADPRWVPYLLIVFAAAAVFFTCENTKRLKGLLTIGRTALTVGLAIGVAAALVLPMLHFAAQSTRSLMTTDDLLEFSLRPADLLKVLVPVYADQAESAIYIGLPVLLLGWFAWAAIPRKKLRAGLLILAAALLLFSLGSVFPLNRWLVQLPGFDLLRVPSRAWLLIGLCASMLAAVGLDRLSKGLSHFTAPYKLVFLALALVLAGLAIGAAVISGTLVVGLAIAAGTSAVTAIVLLCSARIQGRAAAILLAAAMAVDFGIYALSAVEFHPRQEIPAQILEIVKVDAGSARVYSPTFSVPQSAAARHGLELAGGVSPLILKTYAQQFLAATGQWQSGYSVTLPPVPGGDPLANPAALAPDPVQLAEMNVGWVISQNPLQNATSYRLMAEMEGLLVYQVKGTRPRAEWVDVQGKASAATIASYRNNRLLIRVNGPGTLLLRQTWYTGWRVRVDGAPGLIQLHGIYPAVVVGPGEHQVEFVYNPTDLWLGLAISLVSLGIVTGLWLRK